MSTILKNNSIEEDKEELNEELRKLKSLRSAFRTNHLKLLYLLKNNSNSINTLNDTKKYSLEIIKFVNNISKYLSLSNDSMTIIRKLIRALNTVLQNIDKKDVATYLKEYNKIRKEDLSTVLDSQIQISSFLSTNANLLGSNIEHDIELSETLLANENTLIISEKEKKVFLPYKLEDINSYLGEHPNLNFNDVIRLQYTVPLSRYKNPVKSRFLEAYSLIRKKEHGSVKSALDLAFELSLNSRLHPAIITACNDLKELDIYLACLEFNELDDFRYFKIVFEVSPEISSSVSTSKIS